MSAPRYKAMTPRQLEQANAKLATLVDHLIAGGNPKRVEAGSYPTAAQLWHDLCTLQPEARIAKLDAILQNAIESDQAATARSS